MNSADFRVFMETFILTIWGLVRERKVEYLKAKALDIEIIL